MDKPERSGAWPKVHKQAATPQKAAHPIDLRDALGPDHRNILAEMAEDVARARRVAEAGASQALIR
jgi:hypothetical protein